MNKYSLSQTAIRNLDEISSSFAKVSIEAGDRLVQRLDFFQDFLTKKILKIKYQKQQKNIKKLTINQ